MSSPLRIAVITHEIDKFQEGGYLLHRFLSEWAGKGVEFDILVGPQENPPPADLAILHVDITAVGDDYKRLIDRYPRVINGRITDISKSVFSDLIVGQGDAWNGPVIVKTDRNYGGMRELLAMYREGDMRSTIGIQRPWRRVEWLSEYPVFSSPAEVPHGIWRNPNLVVEKFLPERNDDGEYVLRVWVFFGDKEIYYRSFSNEPVIKSNNTLRREHLDPAQLPRSLRETRARLGFDFGKFDFSLTDGGAALYDVNRTPGSPQSGSEDEDVAENIRMLSTGLDSFIDQLQD